MRVGLLADDLTGACDSAAPFVAAGRVQVGLWPYVPSGDLVCAAVSTESRDASAELSRDRSRGAARELRRSGPVLMYRKVDSLLRGNLAADIEGVLADWDGSCLLAPALPEEGRLTVHARLVWPGGEVEIRPLLGAVGDRVRIHDATRREDLAAAAHEVAGEARLLPAGSAGLAAELPAALGLADGHRPGWPSVSRPLVVVGSPAAAAQAGHAAAAGWDVRIHRPGDPLELESHDALFVTGGATAADVLRTLGAHGMELVGEAAPRVPVAILLDGPRQGFPIVLKSGSFGKEDVIATALDRLVRDGC